MDPKNTMKAENAELRADNAKLKKAPDASKKLDDDRMKAFNEVVDCVSNLVKENCKALHRHPIEWYSHDTCIDPSIRPLRPIARKYMTKGNRLVDMKYPEECRQAVTS